MNHGSARRVPLRVVARLALARVSRAGDRHGNSAIFLFDTKDGDEAPGRRSATSTTRSRRSIPKASICSTRPIARSIRSTATSTTRWTYPNPTRLVAVPLRDGRRSRRSPPRNDAERTARRPTTTRRARKARRTTKARTASRARRRAGQEGDEQDDDKPPAARRHRLRRASRRARSCCRRRPATTASSSAVKGKLLYRRCRAPARATRRARSSTSTSTSARRRRSSTTPTAFEVDRRRQEGARGAEEEVRDRRGQGRSRSSRSRCATAEMEVPVDPRAEWQQMFTDAYRFERDFFYDPNMHGVDWAAMRDALPDAARRRGDALGRQLRARRVHRRAERVAHLPRRRRPGAGAAARRRHARRRLGARERRLSHQAHRPRRRRGTPTCARRSPSPASTSRRATTCSP